MKALGKSLLFSASSCRLLLQILGVAAAEINLQSCSLLHTHASALHFLCQELAHLLLYVTHMFQSGVFTFHVSFLTLFCV